MKWIKPHGRLLARLAALMLIGLGAYCGYGWYYKLAPVRRTVDPEWVALHSPQGYWREVQKGIHRGMWTHDDGFTVGIYGDKPWAEWIMDWVKPGESMGHLAAGPTHAATAMRIITNQDLGQEADDWIAWWRKNRAKSQEQWIEDGFRKRGIEVDVPPTSGQIPVLLTLLGMPETNAESALPYELKYNAFRCLRDTGFEPVSYAIETDHPFGEIKRGLMEYAEMERPQTAQNAIGVLAFGKKSDSGSWDGGPLPRITTKKYKITANTVIIGLPLLGLILLLLSFKKVNADP